MIPGTLSLVAESLFACMALGLLWTAGHLASRSWPSPCRAATGAFTGVLLLFFIVLGCDTLGIRIGREVMAAGLILPAAAGGLLARRRGLRLFDAPLKRSAAPRELWRELWWFLPCLIAFVSVVVRGVVDPLAGWDNLWRWDHLARLVFARGTLSAYPPADAADFLAYPWADGIPPLVSLVNLWIYLCAGRTDGALVAARLAFEFALTACLVWRAASLLWRGKAARFALLALSGSALWLGSVSIAQETGIAGLGVLGVAVFALQYHAAPRLSTAVWLGIAAVVAALCRDYHLLMPLVALGLLFALRAPRKHLACVAAVTGLLVIPWCTRNWSLTGNPLYAHGLAGLFPGNAYHDYHMAQIRRFWAPEASWGYVGSLMAPLLAGAGLLAAAAVPGFMAIDRARRLVLLAPVAAVAAVWAWSLASTAGGVVFALRVLGPALPILAVGAGWWGIRGRKNRALLAAVLVAGAADAARRHWIFQLSPLSPPLPYTWTDWRRVDDIHERFSRARLWPMLHAEARGGAIVADNPGHTVHAARLGVPVHPLASPALGNATDPSSPSSPEEVRAALRAAGVRFLVLGEDTTFLRELHGGHPRLGSLYATPPAFVFDGLRVYDLLLSPPATDPALR